MDFTSFQLYKCFRVFVGLYMFRRNVMSMRHFGDKDEETLRCS